MAFITIEVKTSEKYTFLYGEKFKLGIRMKAIKLIYLHDLAMIFSLLVALANFARTASKADLEVSFFSFVSLLVEIMGGGGVGGRWAPPVTGTILDTGDPLFDSSRSITRGSTLIVGRFGGDLSVLVRIVNC